VSWSRFLPVFIFIMGPLLLGAFMTGYGEYARNESLKRTGSGIIQLWFTVDAIGAALSCVVFVFAWVLGLFR